MDCIHIKDLEVWANHGVFPEETKLGQKFVVSVDLYTNIRNAGMNDDLEQSIHYGIVSHRIKRFMEEHTYKLIETVVERLAACLLREFPVEKVRVELKKPWAPIGLPLQTVSVEAERSWHRVFIALGSNMGDPVANLDFGVKQLSEIAGCEVKKVAKYIITKPYGYTEQADFVNSVLELRTLYTPHELLDILHSIEAAAQRERLIHWGPRTLDLDILFYDDMIIDDEDLIIPHIEIPLRDFVLRPLNEIAPGFVHPVRHRTVRDMFLELQKQS